MKHTILLCILLSISSDIFAATMKYTGIVTDYLGSSSLYELVEAGDTIVGQFSYDPVGVLDAYPNNDMVGAYNFNESNSSFQFTVFDSSNSHAVLYQESGRLAYILAENNWEYTPNPSLYPIIDAFTPVGLLDSGSLVYLRYQNRDTNLDRITTDALPLLPLSFDNYNYHTGSISLPSGHLGSLSFDLTGLTPVPIPPAQILFISAIALLAGITGLKRTTLANHCNQIT
ncbi:MAG: hypothetical protein AAES65_06040 [Candidatus Thiodiazotropha sp. (ex. Lucinoma kazani)]